MTDRNITNPPAKMLMIYNVATREGRIVGTFPMHEQQYLNEEKVCGKEAGQASDAGEKRAKAVYRGDVAPLVPEPDHDRSVDGKKGPDSSRDEPVYSSVCGCRLTRRGHEPPLSADFHAVDPSPSVDVLLEVRTKGTDMT